ncbi:hypothetical protein F5B19DRAFT_217282 [Rostrohypoxylon terebratum]|nr:hypothetical protein F5B19DRAFT_217282 [Rostrohypoxylon terebratum]
MWSRDDSFERIQRVVNLLTTSFRFRVNPTCNFSVGVGNGMKLFTAATIKKIGAFLWAGDPLFSRIHAPWRRVHDKSQCISLDGNLAHGVTAKQASKKCEGEQLEGVDTEPVTGVSETSLGEKEYGSKERLEEFAQWRCEVGPYLTLDEDVNDVDSHHSASDYNNDEDGSSDSGENNDSNSECSSDDDDEWWLADGSNESEPRLPFPRDVWADGERALEKDRRIHVPADLNTLHRNIGWVFWDKDRDQRVLEWIYEFCMDYYGDFEVHELTSEEQLTLVLQAHCNVMFGHSDFQSDPDQEYEVIVASERYLADVRSSWEWNEEEEKWDLAWRCIGNFARHPAAHREIKIDAPAIVQKFENLAKLTELDNEDSDVGIQYVSPEEYNKARRTNRGIEELFDDLKDYAQPLNPNFRTYLADPKTEHAFYSSEDSLTTAPSGPFSPSAETGDEDTEIPFPPEGLDLAETGDEDTEILFPPERLDLVEIRNKDIEIPFLPERFDLVETGDKDIEILFPPEGLDQANWAMMLEETKMVGKIGEENMNDSEDFSTDPSSSSVYSYDLSSECLESTDSINDRQRKDIMKYINGVETPEPQVQLRPHNSGDFDAVYEECINKYAHIAEEEWERMGHPPPSSNSDCGQSITTEQDVNGTPTYSTAAATGLLRRDGLQVNYDFTPYSPESPEEPTTPTDRPINFRGMGRSLDADWIAMWARICVGVVRWTHNASTDEYLRTIDRVMEHECRELMRVDRGEPEPVGEEDHQYDACNLLEDLGLYSEAGWVWRREQERGHPR